MIYRQVDRQGEVAQGVLHPGLLTLFGSKTDERQAQTVQRSRLLCSRSWRVRDEASRRGDHELLQPYSMPGARLRGSLND